MRCAPVGEEFRDSQRTPRLAVRLLAIHALASSLALLPGWTQAQTIDVQAPGARMEVVAGLSERLVYRDVLISPEPSVSVAAAIAQYGFSASLWAAKAGDSPHALELLLGYSHKLPLFDFHIGYVRSNLPPFQSAIDNAIRLSITNNLSHSTLVDLTYDRGFEGNKSITAASLTYRMGSYTRFDFAGRASASNWDLSGTRIRATGIQLMARHALGKGLEAHLVFHLGHSRQTGLENSETNYRNIQMNFVYQLGAQP